MRLLRVSFVLVGAIFGACTAVQSTPQQELVWSAYNQCKAEGQIPNNIQVVRVEPDGRAWYSAHSSAYGSQALERCVTDKVVSSSGAAPPTPRDLPALSP